MTEAQLAREAQQIEIEERAHLTEAKLVEIEKRAERFWETGSDQLATDVRSLVAEVRRLAGQEWGGWRQLREFALAGRRHNQNDLEARENIHRQIEALTRELPAGEERAV